MTELPRALTATLSRFIAESSTAAWPEEILELGRRHILDTLANSSTSACWSQPWQSDVAKHRSDRTIKTAA